MFINPEDTTIMAGVKFDATRSILERHLIEAGTLDKNPQSELLVLGDGIGENTKLLALGSGSGSLSPKPFLVPIRITHNEKVHFIIDGRAWTRYDRATRQPAINNTALSTRDISLLQCTVSWLENDPSSIQRFNAFPMAVFSSWISGLISYRFGLDAEKQNRLMVLAAYYYHYLHVPTEEVVDPSAVAVSISRAVRNNTRYVLDTIQDLVPPRDIPEFLELIKANLETDRLEGLAPDTFVILLNGSFFGPNSASIVGVAIEYPAWFTALVWVMLNDRSFNRSGLGSVIHNLSRQPSAIEFVRFYLNFLKSFKSDFRDRL